MTTEAPFNWQGAMAALLGRYPALEDEPQLGAMLQSEVSSMSLLGIIKFID